LVRITGRPRHAYAMMVPSVSMGAPGFEYIVPVVTKEKDDLSD